MHRPTRFAACAALPTVAATLTLATFLVLLGCSHGPSDSSADGDATTADSAPTQTIRLDVGLTDDEAALWHHHDEGSGFLPLSFFYALEDSTSGRPLIEVLPNYGFVADPDDEFGLPIGLSAAPVITAPTQDLQVGVSCSACHSGQYTYQGTALNIDGAPNMLRFKALLDSLETSLEATLESPSKLYRLVRTLMDKEQQLHASEAFAMPTDALTLLDAASKAPAGSELGNLHQHLVTTLHEAYHSASQEVQQQVLEQGGEAMPTVDAASHDAGDGAFDSVRTAFATFSKNLEYIQRHLERLRTLQKAFAVETESGPGRADSFGAIWDLLIQQDRLMPLNAPVSIPHLYQFASYTWVHWDGNSTDVVGRDLAQAIALGADYDPETQISSVLPHNIIDLETTARKIQSPAWPVEILGPIDPTQRDAGELLFGQHCARCHSGETLVPVDEVGTDPQRLTNFAAATQDGKTYPELLIELGSTVAEASFAAHDVTPEQLAPVLRSDNPTWRITNGYQTRRLDGLWASAPYLHNGSVPTLWDLLQPAAERPKTFAVGRELDPVKLGINAAHQPGNDWIFDTSQVGNSNAGHEYGTELSAEEKWQLVEYLKSM